MQEIALMYLRKALEEALNAGATQLFDDLFAKLSVKQVDALVKAKKAWREAYDREKRLKEKRLKEAGVTEDTAKKVEALKTLPIASGLEGESTSNIVPFDRNKDKKGSGQSGTPAAT